MSSHTVVVPMRVRGGLWGHPVQSWTTLGPQLRADTWTLV